MTTKKRIFMIFILLSGLALAGCAGGDDVGFARRALSLLIRGRFSARTMIDWPKLKMLGYDVGKEYSAFKTEEARGAYIRAFIENFSRGFKEQKAKESAFFNWRYASEDRSARQQVVAANCVDASRTFLFVISHEGMTKKLVELYVLSTPSGAQAALPQAEAVQTGVEDVAQAQ